MAFDLAHDQIGEFDGIGRGLGAPRPSDVQRAVVPRSKLLDVADHQPYTVL